MPTAASIMRGRTARKAHGLLVDDIDEPGLGVFEALLVCEAVAACVDDGVGACKGGA